MWRADVWAKDKTPATGASFTAVGVAAFSSRRSPIRASTWTWGQHRHDAPRRNRSQGSASDRGTRSPGASLHRADRGRARYGATAAGHPRPILSSGSSPRFVDFSQFNAAKDFRRWRAQSLVRLADGHPVDVADRKYKDHLRFLRGRVPHNTWNDTNRGGASSGRLALAGPDDLNGPLVATLLNNKATAATAGA